MLLLLAELPAVIDRDWRETVMGELEAFDAEPLQILPDLIVDLTGAAGGRTADVQEMKTNGNKIADVPNWNSSGEILLHYKAWNSALTPSWNHFPPPSTVDDFVHWDV